MTSQFTFRCEEKQVAELAAVRSRLPMLSTSAIAREALRLGLAALAADPVRLLRPTAETGHGVDDETGTDDAA